MFILSFILSFLFGAAVGSFLAVLIDRLRRGETFISGRSKCESCKRTLTPSELIPILSFFLQKGKCKGCKAKIPSRLIIAEILTGLSFAGLFLLYYFGGIGIIELIYLILILSISIGIFISDIAYGIIPDELVVAFLSVSLLYGFVFVPFDMTNHFLSGIVLMLLFLILFLSTKGRGMGFGDVKLSFALGIFLGFPKIIVSTYMAFLTGAFVSVILIMWGKKRLKKDTIPFGPFLIFSALVSYFIGEILIAQFLDFFQR
ncbi:MAG: Type 4 prepilin-like protein leader peptide-processing enzyme [Candidatus Levybacteria bacterium GW2011_GWA1_39_11]|nr:MAG: Type 4 prepilin-like protein leader peptide-processing enzyme [Candidatus Levybacteria bacterium GW2011_GWA1_39_11]